VQSLPGKSANAMTIGTLARAAHVNVETIRYYQRIGLLAEPAKQNSYRYYDQSYLKRLQFIRHAKDAGFTLEEIREVFELDATNDRQKIHAISVRRLEDIEKRIRDLQSLRNYLQELVHLCETEHQNKPCPIVKKLAGT
jgi:MerR family mercuric resistance operon transcriptional regulator